MEINLSRYTAEEYDNYKKLQDKIEEAGKNALFESVFYPKIQLLKPLTLVIGYRSCNDFYIQIQKIVKS